MVDKLVAKYKETVQQMADGASVSYTEYVKDTFGLEEKEFDENLKSYMEETAKINLVLEAIEKKENLTMSESETEEAIKKYAEDMGYETKEELFESYKEEDVKKYVQQMKVLNFIVDSSKLVEPKNATEQPAGAEGGDEASSSSEAPGSSEAPASSEAPSSAAGN